MASGISICADRGDDFSGISVLSIISRLAKGISVNISLREVTNENWRAIVRLEPGGDQQFVAANVYSLAEARVNPDWTPLAIYVDDEPVGFLMYGQDPDDGQFWIIRMMVDAAQQGNGYGRAALHLVLDRLRAEPGCDSVMIGWVPENVVAGRLYESFGFRKLDDMVDGEIVARLDL
jgi:diamine N-acetyltransferase